MKEKKFKGRASKISFWLCLGISIILMIGGAICPPPFVIDASIFKAVGWLFAFAALGQLPDLIQSDKSARLEKGDIALTIGDKLHPRKPEPPYEETDNIEDIEERDRY